MTITSQYFQKSEFEVYVRNLKKEIEEIYGDSVSLSDLEPYAKKEDLDKLNTELNRNFSNYVSKPLFQEYWNEMSRKVGRVETNCDELYAKKSDVQGQFSNLISNFDSTFRNYYTIDETHTKFLLKEDYRGIKDATTLNYQYNDYPDLFFDVIHNDERIKIYDGFYIIEDKAYILKDNKIVPIWTNNSTVCWDVEKDDIPWKDQVENWDNLNSNMVDMSRELLRSTSSNSVDTVSEIIL